MPRTVVPLAGGAAGGDGGTAGDGLPEKLVKYVPAETIGFFVPVSAAVGTGNEGWLIAVVVVALLGTPAYLFQMAPETPASKPRVHYYVLAEIALVCWMLGTSSAVQSWVGISQTLGGVVLAIGTFAIPITDGVLTKLNL